MYSRSPGFCTNYILLHHCLHSYFLTIYKLELSILHYLLINTPSSDLMQDDIEEQLGSIDNMEEVESMQPVKSIKEVKSIQEVRQKKYQKN